MKKWYYYLHKNGDLISKSPAVVDADTSYFDSPFVVKIWTIDLTNRESAWDFILEALSLGAKIERVKELAEKWGLTFEDSLEYISRTKPTEQLKKWLEEFVTKILEMDVKEYWTSVKELTS